MTSADGSEIEAGGPYRSPEPLVAAVVDMYGLITSAGK